MKKKEEKEVLKVESIQRGQNLYTNYTVIRIENSVPLFIKDVDKSVFNDLIDADIKKINLILEKLGNKVLIGNPNTEKPEKILKISKEEKSKKKKSKTRTEINLKLIKLEKLKNPKK